MSEIRYLASIYFMLIWRPWRPVLTVLPFGRNLQLCQKHIGRFYFREIIVVPVFRLGQAGSSDRQRKHPNSHTWPYYRQVTVINTAQWRPSYLQILLYYSHIWCWTNYGFHRTFCCYIIPPSPSPTHAGAGITCLCCTLHRVHVMKVHASNKEYKDLSTWTRLFC